MIKLLRSPGLEKDGFCIFRNEEVLSEDFQRVHAQVFGSLKPGENTTNDLLRGIVWGSHVNGGFQWLKRTSYSLTGKENPEEEGRVRRFGLLPEGYVRHPDFESLLRRTFEALCFPEASDQRIYEVQVSGLRYMPTLAKPAFPAPIAPHQDRVDGAVIVMSRTANLGGGLTRIYDLDEWPQYELDLQPGEALLIRDQRLKHQVTPVVLEPGPTWRPEQAAYRDVVIIRFQAVGR
jgi:hypothetical protein